MRPAIALSVLLAASTPAHAADEEYLLGDIGVRVDLPKGWEPTQWSDQQLRAQTKDGSVLLFVWSSPIQDVPEEADLALYGTHWTEILPGFGANEPAVTASSLQDRAGTPTVRGALDFTLGSAKGRAFVASQPVEGQVVHLATIGSIPNARKTEKALDELLERMEVRKPAVPVDDGGVIEGQGVRIDLPAGWRAPLPTELEAVGVQLANLPVKDLGDCAIALHPRGPTAPDVLANCQGGYYLGVVDEYTFADREEELRPVMFGAAPVQAAVIQPLEDRTAFLYTAEIVGKPMIVGVSPYDQGLSRLFVLGQDVADVDRLRNVTVEALQGSTFSGPHPVSPDQTIGYYVMYRPTHPGVLGSACGCLCLGLGMGAVGSLVVVTGRRRSRQREEQWG